MKIFLPKNSWPAMNFMTICAHLNWSYDGISATLHSIFHSVTLLEELEDAVVTPPNHLVVVILSNLTSLIPYYLLI